MFVKFCQNLWFNLHLIEILKSSIVATSTINLCIFCNNNLFFFSSSSIFSQNKCPSTEKKLINSFASIMWQNMTWQCMTCYNAECDITFEIVCMLVSWNTLCIPPLSFFILLCWQLVFYPEYISLIYTFFGGSLFKVLSKQNLSFNHSIFTVIPFSFSLYCSQCPTFLVIFHPFSLLAFQM